MKFAFLDQMLCPYCGANFDIEYVIEQTEFELVNGIVKCNCSEFPILNGILILNANSLNESIIKSIRDKSIERATILCLGIDYFERINLERTTSLLLPFPPQITGIIRHFISNLAEATAVKKFRSLCNKYLDKNIPYSNLLGNTFFDSYLKHRFSTSSFWSLYSFLPIISKKKMRILDLGCGAGHGSFVISEYVEPLELCCADKNYNLLYIAKKYFSPKANFVCFDFDEALPFKNGIFSSILMADALMFVKSRFSFVREIERLLMPDGFSLFSHVHNSLGSNFAPIELQKNSVTPRAWRELFENTKLTTILFSEEAILRDFLFENKLELRQESTEAELNSSDALIIMATNDTDILKNYHSANSVFLKKKNNLIINPIYKIIREKDKIILQRSSLGVESVGDSYPMADKYIPKSLEINKDLILNESEEASNSEAIENLIRKFVILNVPKKYI